MNKVKENKLFMFVTKYKIAIILGFILACGVSFFPVDYTEEVANLDKEISNYKSKIQEEENKHLKVANDIISEKLAVITNDIQKLKPEINDLENTKEELQAKYDEQLKIEADKKAEEREQAMKEENERRAGKWILESNGYNVWEAYLTPGTYSLTVNHKGRGNCIVHAGTKEAQKQNLVINKIGAGKFAGTFRVNTSGYYTLTFKTDSAFDFEYKPF